MTPAQKRPPYPHTAAGSGGFRLRRYLSPRWVAASANGMPASRYRIPTQGKRWPHRRARCSPPQLREEKGK